MALRWPYNYRYWDNQMLVSAMTYLLANGAFDSIPILKNMADFAKTKGFLSKKQADFVKTRLSKFISALPRDVKDLPGLDKPAEVPAGYEISIYNPKTIRIDYPDKYSALYRRAKSIPGFVSKKDYALIPYSKRNCHALISSGFVAGKHIQQFLDKPEKYNPVDDSGLKMTLKEYQKQGLAYLMAKGGNAILADEQGLGKTAQAIAWGELSGINQICVVCPASLKANWRKEIIQWTGKDSIVILSGKMPDKDVVKQMKKSKWIIINYDVLIDWGDILEDLDIPAWIYDEAQALKNEASIRHRSAALLSKGKKTLLLSGTPIENRPAEFLAITRLIDPQLFPNKMRFYERYCDLKRDEYGYTDYSGASNIPELNRILRDTMMIRRKKADVLQELPDKMTAVIPISLNKADMKEYTKIEEDFTEWFAMADMGKDVRAQAANKIEALKQCAAMAKLPMVYNWIDTYLENEAKLVVFAHHKAVISALRAHYKNCCVVIDGSVDTASRQAIVDDFQTNPKTKLFIGNIKAAGTGITLTAAKDTLTIELAWTSTAHDQCADRVHRIGQKNAVTAYYLIAENTVEEKIISLLDKKRQLVTQALDGEDVENMDLLSELLKQYTSETLWRI